jgi:hypothetical protein
VSNLITYCNARHLRNTRPAGHGLEWTKALPLTAAKPVRVSERLRMPSSTVPWKIYLTEA